MKTSRRAICYLPLLIVFSAFFWRDYALLFQSDAATGIDGYYYVLQVDSLLNTGRLYFPTVTPLVIYILAALSVLIGNTIVAVKIGALTLQVALCFGVASLLHILTKSVWLASVGVFLLMFSVLHLYFLSEFVSNLGALGFFVWGGFGIVKAAKEKRHIWYVFAALMFLASCFSHRSAVWVIISMLSAFLFSQFWLNYAKNLRKQLTLTLPVLILFVFPCILAWQSFFGLPQWLSSEFLKYPQSPFHSLALMESIMSLIFSVIIVFVLFYRPGFVDASQSNIILLTIVLWNILFTLNPFLNHESGISGLVGRLNVTVYSLVAVAVPLFFSTFFSISVRFGFVVFAFTIPILCLKSFAPFPVGLRFDYLQNRKKLIQELPLMRNKLCAKPLIVAKHGEQFLISALMQIPSQQKPLTRAEYDCVYWLIYQNESATLVEDSEIRRKFGIMDRDERNARIQDNPHLRALLEKETLP